MTASSINLFARHQQTLDARRTLVRKQLEPLPKTTHAITWEVGSGHGHFLNAYAAAHPGEICVGVDIESDRIRRADTKRARASLENLFFIRAEARLFLESLPATVRLAKIFVLFPDPWPKSRHHKHRILQASFLTQLAPHVTTDARLYFRTDHQPYFDAAQQCTRAHPEWVVVEEPWPFEHSTVFQSRAAHHASFVARRRSAGA